MKVRRRDGFYEVIGNGRLFQIEQEIDSNDLRSLVHWKLREYFGPVAGWSEADFFDTFREAKEEAVRRIEMSEGS